MAKHENLPFPVGQTFFGDQTPDTAVGGHLEGKEYEIEDLDYSATGGAKPHRTGRLRTMRIVRNTSGISLLPKRLAILETTAGKDAVGQVDGYSRLTAAGNCFPIDEFLPSTGVAANDLFYVCVGGPATVLTALEGDANNVHSVGGWVVALTAVTSQSTTAGRVKPQDLTGATSVLGNEVQHRLGRALSARTTANTGADLLVDVTKW